MSAGDLIRGLSAWLGLPVADAFALVSLLVGTGAAVGTLLAVVVAVLTARAARRDTARVEKLEERRAAAARQLRADQAAFELATRGKSRSADVLVASGWSETEADSEYWQLTWAVDAPNQVVILSARSLPPLVVSANDRSAVDLLRQTGTTRHVASSGRPFDGHAQAYVEGERDLTLQPGVEVTFRDGSGSEWQLDTNHRLVLLNPRTVRARLVDTDPLA